MKQLMEHINKENAHFTSTHNLNKIPNDEWEIIRRQKNSYILDDNGNTSYLKWPGYYFSNKEAQIAYLKIFKDFIDQNIYTPSRGNLSKDNNKILIGIRPGHVYAHLSKADTAWLFGPSSRLLHKLLISTDIYPYFTNIYNEPNKSFNKDFSFIFKELLVIFYIYDKIYNKDELDLVFMGGYDEYPELVKTIVNSSKFLNNFKIKLNCYKIWHPAYLSRGYDEDKLLRWKQQLENKERKIIEFDNREKQEKPKINKLL